MRAALEEFIALGPHTVRPAEQRLADRLAAYPSAERTAALAVARDAVDVSFQMAREDMHGKQSQASIARTLIQRFPWLSDPAPSKPRSWWWRLFTTGTTQRPLDLATRLANYGRFLEMM